MPELKNVVRICLFLVCSAGFKGIAFGEETSYSADSLMATFKKGSTVSVKGTEITLTGVVAEIKKSSLIFKSSENDKVVCDLDTPFVGSVAPVVGKPFTVVGKVKGRGMLGNVTLERCGTPATALASTAISAVAEPVHETVVEPAPLTELPINQPVEPSAAERKPSTATPAVATRAPTIPATHPVITSFADANPVDTALPVRPDIPTVTQTPAPIEEQPQSPAPRQASSLSPGLLRVLAFAMVAILGIIALLKVGSIFAARMRPKTNLTVTEKVRRDALEALLAADKKKKVG